jgi:hypothetical protein
MDAPETIAAEYLRRGIVIDIGSAVSRGWGLVRDNMGVLIGATVLGWLITLGLAFVPVVGWVVGIVLLGGLDYMFISTWRWPGWSSGCSRASGSRCASCRASTLAWDTCSRCRLSSTRRWSSGRPWK